VFRSTEIANWVSAASSAVAAGAAVLSARRSPKKTF
jgi:hypothetical protein